MQKNQETQPLRTVEDKPKSVLKKKASIIANEEDCQLEETLSSDTSSVASLDTGSTFDLTNGENALTKTVKAKSLIVSKTNVGKQLSDKLGMTPGLTDGMWLDEMSLICEFFKTI